MKCSMPACSKKGVRYYNVWFVCRRHYFWLVERDLEKRKEIKIGDKHES